MGREGGDGLDKDFIGQRLVGSWDQLRQREGHHDLQTRS